MSDSWKTIPINAGLLTAAITGVLATVLTVHGVQLWVDSRVGAALDNRVAPLEGRMERFSAQIERVSSQQRANNNAQRARDEELLEAIRGMKQAGDE